MEIRERIGEKRIEGLGTGALVNDHDVPTEFRRNRVGKFTKRCERRRRGEFRDVSTRRGGTWELAARAEGVERDLVGDRRKVLTSLHPGLRRQGLFRGRRQDVADAHINQHLLPVLENVGEIVHIVGECRGDLISNDELLGDGVDRGSGPTGSVRNVGEDLGLFRSRIGELRRDGVRIVEAGEAEVLVGGALLGLEKDQVGQICPILDRKSVV